VTRRPDIEITIDELVVTGMSRHDAEVVAQSLRRELAAGAMAWEHLPASGSERDVVELRVVPGASAGALGRQVAEALQHHLTAAEPPGPGA
jgi:hypothetical protein